MNAKSHRSPLEPLVRRRRRTGEVPMISDDRVCSFHVGQVWETPRGNLFRVIDVARGGSATLRLGIDGSGRKVRRDWDAVLGWVLHSDKAPPIDAKAPEYLDMPRFLRRGND